MESSTESPPGDVPVIGGLSVVVIEDAPEMRILLTSMLERHGCKVAAAGDGPDGLTLVKTLDPTVIVLDVGLPSMDGFQVCRSLRTFTDAYVIMLTARGEEHDRVHGLRAGADDYLTKPFAPLELLARIEAVTRRPRRATPTVTSNERLTVADMQIDLVGRRLEVGGRAVSVTKIEFDLLVTLCRLVGTALSRDDLTRAVWGDDWVGDSHLIDVHIANLRKKIDVDRPHITTVRGVGYRVDDSPV